MYPVSRELLDVIERCHWVVRAGKVCRTDTPGPDRFNWERTREGEGQNGSDVMGAPYCRRGETDNKVVPYRQTDSLRRAHSLVTQPARPRSGGRLFRIQESLTSPRQHVIRRHFLSFHRGRHRRTSFSRERQLVITRETCLWVASPRRLSPALPALPAASVPEYDDARVSPPPL